MFFKKSNIFYLLLLFYYKISSVFLAINNYTGYSIDIKFTTLDFYDYVYKDHEYPIARLEDKRLYNIDLDKLKDVKDLIISYTNKLKNFWSGKIIIPFLNVQNLIKKFPNSSFLLTFKPEKFIKNFEFNPELGIISNANKRKGSLIYPAKVISQQKGKDKILKF